MSKIDYERKAQVLSNGDYENYRFYRQSFHPDLPLNEKSPFANNSEAVAYANWKMENDAENWRECERLDHARCSRVRRLKLRVDYMVRRGCLFVTLTFTDEVLAKTSPKTRHEYVKRFLRNFPCAIANIDFGAENGREHYHCVVVSKNLDTSLWKYGIVNVKRVKCGDDAAIAKQTDKLACYSSKLVNHAIKDTTKGARTIYSGSWPGNVTDHLPGWIDDDSVMAKREKYARKVDADNGVVHSEFSQMSFVRMSDDLKFVFDEL